MGLHDAEEMLEAAKEQAIIDERQIAQLQGKLNAISDAVRADDADGWDEAPGTVAAVVEILDA